MLQDTDNLVNHIATSFGYVGASSFPRAFKA
jgi:AraC-like DNA-binding protein